MQLNAIQLDELPKLAWCLRIKKNHERADLYHGSDVQVGSDYFYEGIWDGSIEKKTFDTSVSFLGSGGKIINHTARICTPTHTFQKICTYKNNDTFYASNSLAFLLALSGNTILLDYPYYSIDTMSIIKGFDNYTDSIPVSKGSVDCHYYCNIEVDCQLNVKKLAKNPVQRFHNFEEYRGFLNNTIQNLLSNALATKRSQHYRPISTISSGYDSPMCSAIMRNFGCKEAITFVDARKYQFSDNDSGENIGKHLGYTVHKYHRLDYLSSPGMPEIEFFSLGTEGEDVIFSPMASLLNHKILVTGYNGDNVWGFKKGTRRCIRRSDPSAMDLEEFRLRVGFIHFPLPALGAVNYPDIQAISKSREMRPWVLGLIDDRPIPRRILDEAGIPREWYAQEKRAVTIAYAGEGLKERMKPESYQDFMQFYHQLPPSNYPWLERKHHWTRALYNMNVRLNSFTNPKLRRLHVPLKLKPVISRVYKFQLGLISYTFHWSMLKMITRYQQALGSFTHLTSDFSLIANNEA